MNVHIFTIPHKQQRYNTVGDYETEAGVTKIRVSDLGNEHYEFLVAYHELTELTLCRKDKITDKMIDDFDFAFAASRDPTDASEPGDEPTAPYYQQHQFATAVEKAMAAKLAVDWEKYEARIAEVMETYPVSED